MDGPSFSGGQSSRLSTQLIRVATGLVRWLPSHLKLLDGPRDEGGSGALSVARSKGRWPVPGLKYFCLPAGDLCGESDPHEGRGGGGFWRAPPPPARWRTSAKKPGGAPSTSTPSRVAPRRAVRGGGHAMPAPHGALPHRIWAIRANPCPMRVSGHSLDHSGEDFAL